MRKVPVGLFSLLIAAGFSSCQTEDLKRAEQSPDAVKLVVNWRSYDDLASPLAAMEEVLRAMQSETRASDPSVTIDALWEQWDVFKFAVEPRPYLYDDGRGSSMYVILEDYLHDGKKNVYEWWFLDTADPGDGISPGTWKMKLEHTNKALPMILAVDRYWAAPVSAGGWVHSSALSQAVKEAEDRNTWIGHDTERMSNYRATYIQVRTRSSELRKFLEDNGLFLESAGSGRMLYEEMMAFLTSNLSLDIIIDDGVDDGTRLEPGIYDDGLGSSTEDLNASYATLLPSLVLNRLVLERQQKPANGFTYMGLEEPPPLHPNDVVNNGTIKTWTRGVASRGMLFEFFFGAITPKFDFPGDPYQPFEPPL